MKWQDNCTNSWHGVDDAGGCARGCLDVFVMIVTHPSPRRPGVVVAAIRRRSFAGARTAALAAARFRQRAVRPIPILRCLAGMLAPTLPGGTGRDDYVAGTIAMSGAMALWSSR
jgi:hypothetical protein